MTPITNATEAQNRAADPALSTWVSANAGSGKTRVLTDRVARLLLRGSDPQRILCLTYTTAAAGEMQNRLFKRLGQWAMMDDGALRGVLTGMGEDTSLLTSDKLKEARTLFANALETPGGLKIQTIHAFCDTLLRRFPLEAGVSPSFGLMDDRQMVQVHSDILGEIAEATDAKALQDFALIFSGHEFNRLILDIAKFKSGFGGGVSAQDFNLVEDQTIDAILRGVLDAAARKLVAEFIPILDASGGNNQKAAKKLHSALESPDPHKTLRLLEGVFLHSADVKKNTPFSAKTGAFPTKPVREANPDLTDDLNNLMLAVEAARETRLCLLTYQNTRVLHGFADAFLHRSATHKARLGLLDYDDLIDKALSLLETSEAAQWVLYKLDGGIDHVLVDEAQDTSPKQWHLIQNLVAEFTTGLSARDMPRTVFAVGDEKQSIYSFQGADPREFAKMRDHFQAQFKQVGQPLFQRSLIYSFRSAEPILRLVDTIFDGQGSGRLVYGSQHAASDDNKPGRIDLWPIIEPAEAAPDIPWYQPVNQPNIDDPVNQLARRIAGWIGAAVADKHPVWDSKMEPPSLRPARWGDFLILVRGRGQGANVSLFQSVIKQLKVQGVPTAGQDRLDVAAELAVKDILSVLKFALTEQDDLSLAEALRSPLIGLSEAELFQLAQGRKGTLWASLLAHRDQFSLAHAMLSDILNRADFERPFELVQRILLRYHGRRNILARLGHEAEEAVDQLLAETLNYERIEAPTLTGFLDWFENGDIVAKRQMDGSADLVRIMTVHGSKGLEAPIVILPDTLPPKPQDTSKLYALPNGTVAWKSNSKEASGPQQEAKDRNAAIRDEEALRLLYVALTRAETRLIVCGAGKLSDRPEAWYNLVQQGLTDLNATTHNYDDWGQGLTLQNSGWTDHVTHVTPAKTDDNARVPEWASRPATAMARPTRPLSPSDLGGAKTIPPTEPADSGMSPQEAARHGTDIHTLLEHLPAVTQDRWPATAERLLILGQDRSQEDRAKALAEAEKVLLADDLKWVFSDAALSEVGIAAPIAQLGGRVIDGFIDRLIVRADRITAIDYKSNAEVPELVTDVPEGLLAQMGAYLLALKQIYPDHQVDVAILWTKTTTLMTLPHNIVINACGSHTTS